MSNTNREQQKLLNESIEKAFEKRKTTMLSMKIH